MSQALPAIDEHQDIRDAVRQLCASFDSNYWQSVDEQRGYPEAFVEALTKAGWLAALIPQQFGGSGLNLTQASVIMEEINLSGGNAGACHGQMYNMGTVLRHGSDLQKQTYLPRIASGEYAFCIGLSEPDSGSDLASLRTKAEKDAAVISLREQAEAATTFEGERAAYREYYRALFRKMKQLDNSLSKKCDLMEKAYLTRLAQTRIEPTIPLEPPPKP